MNGDFVTKLLGRALDVVFAKYPARTGLGVVLGCVLLFLTYLFAPLLARIDAVAVDRAPWWGWIALGVLIAHLRTLLAFMGQKPTGSDSIDQALDVIERGNFSESERRRHYRNLVERTVANVALNDAAAKEVGNVKKSLSRGGSAR